MKYLYLFLLCLLATNTLPSGAFAGHPSVYQDISGFFRSEWSVWGIIRLIGEVIDNIWNYRITVIDKRPIAVSNVVIGLVLFAVSLKLARYLSELIGKKLLAIMHLEASVRDALEKISYYIFIVLFTLIVLDVSNVPLTVFTFVGGALAIGIGFGSQNIISNFISGLILMVERPIKVGDLIEIDTTLGRVLSIGARCTHIRTGSNIDIFLPNSKVLENKVTNWTLNDNKVRIKTSVTVSYESDTRLAEETLLALVTKAENVLPIPAPEVFFNNFGESGIVFEINFWMEMNAAIDKSRIISNLNHAINMAFREQNIAIPYPKREVQLMNGKEPVAVIIRS